MLLPLLLLLLPGGQEAARRRQKMPIDTEPSDTEQLSKPKASGKHAASVTASSEAED